MRNKLRSDWIASSEVSLLEAMKKIDLNKGRELFLVDHKGHLHASISDGDIRRGLLSGNRSGWSGWFACPCLVVL